MRKDTNPPILVEHENSYLRERSEDGLLESISISEDELNILFLSLFFTAIGVFLGANMLLIDLSTFQRTARIAVPCLAILAIFFALSRSLTSVAWGLVVTYALLWVLIYSRQSWLLPIVYATASLALAHEVTIFLRSDHRQH